MSGGERVLILPGWLNSGAAHWHSRWEPLQGCERVEQADWMWPRRGAWMARLDEAVLANPRPAHLAAHRLGCHLAATWAAHSRHTALVDAALLVAPPDVERQDMPPQVTTWRLVARHRLPFPALAVPSDDDPFCAPKRARAMAADWGASVVSLGAAGHVNGDSGLDDWPDGLAWLRRLPAR